MNRIYLKDVYYRPNKKIKEYKDIFLETDIGILKIFPAALNLEVINELHTLDRLYELDSFKTKYSELWIEEVRRTYDSDIYLLVSDKFLVVIEYTLNSNFEDSTQEFRIIDNIKSSNKSELDTFNELEIIQLTCP